MCFLCFFSSLQFFSNGLCFMSFCVFFVKFTKVIFVFFGRKKHKNTLALWCNLIVQKKDKNTKTHSLSGAILMLKKDKETFCQCVFVLFGEKNTKRQKHIGSLVQSYCWEEEKKWVNVFLCFPEKNTKTQKHIGCLVQS